MNPENSYQLMQICPEIFGNLDKRAPIALFGFECGDGWFNLLKDLIHEIKAILIDMPSIAMQVDQVKEKYGTLRFYYTIDWPEDYDSSLDRKDDIDDAIVRAEVRSGCECENCGKEANLNRKLDWYSTRCDGCSK